MTCLLKHARVSWDVERVSAEQALHFYDATKKSVGSVRSYPS